MRTIHSYAIVAIAVMGLAASVSLAAQQSSDLLSGKEAQTLALNAKTPAEHAKLQKHFLALAAKYEAEAADHTGLAQAERKNGDQINGKLFPGSAAKRGQHCDKLSVSLKAAAKDAQELATEHGKMSH